MLGAELLEGLRGPLQHDGDIIDESVATQVVGERLGCRGGDRDVEGVEERALENHVAALAGVATCDALDDLVLPHECLDGAI